MTLKRQSLNNFILKRRGLLKILAVVAITVACKAEATKSNCN